jgi:hypothetical protein
MSHETFEEKEEIHLELMYIVCYLMQSLWLVLAVSWFIQLPLWLVYSSASVAIFCSIVKFKIGRTFLPIANTTPNWRRFAYLVDKFNLFGSGVYVFGVVISYL